MSNAPQSGPLALSEKVESLGAPVRLDVLVTCACCREGHAGLCVGDLVSEGDACPVGWVSGEVERRGLESGKGG